MNITQLKTPALLIDKSTLKRNAENMLAKASSMQVKLRPHVKTHKSVEIAKIQLGGTSGGRHSCERARRPSNKSRNGYSTARWSIISQSINDL